jgi:hypothetical protein
MRMPASIVGYGPNPWSQLVNLWSEPPYAVIGLGTGTMASYARPYQQLHYYEIDNHIRRFSEVLTYSEDGRPFFTYVTDARERGGNVEILMGDARLRMGMKYLPLEEGREELARKGVNVEAFYSDTDEGKELRDQARALSGGAQQFYHMMVVDAFSSDAIPIHLLTKEAVKMYMEHLVEDGVLCVHTSNRHIALVPVVADIADALGLASVVGHDQVKEDAKGHSTSEWVMVARKREYLNHLKAPPDYDETRLGPYWTDPPITRQHVWTDDYSNLMSVYRDFHPELRH